MTDELAIRFEHVSKEYRLGAIGGGTLRGDLQSWMAKKKGREDPNSRIGSENIGRTGEKFLALNDISFEVKKGEALGIIGHNGAGKSTLLKLLSRVTAPTAGKISYNGRIASMLEVGTGFHPELTGRENVYMNGAILGMTKSEIDEKFNEIVSFAEMDQFIDTPVKRYSSGMYVKLAFAVAAHLDSEIMIMDEVLAVGDMNFQKKCLDKMRNVADKQGRTVLYVSHNMNTIRQLCDRCVVLNKGKIRFIGNVDEAIDIYMNESGTSRRLVDLKSLKRTLQVQGGASFNAISMVERDRWEINVGEKLRFKISYTANEDIKNIGYRSRLASVDGTSITVLMAPRLMDCQKGKTYEVTMEADLSMLVPGRYTLTPVLYGVNEYGASQFYDHVDKAVIFEVMNIPDFNENMNWEQRWWGNVKLPDMKSIKIAEVE